MSTHTVALSGVTPEQVALLSASGITNDVDLGTLSQADFDDILPSATIVTRRRLFSIGQYATSGESITATTTMLEILTKLNTKSTNPTNVTAPSTAAFFQDPSRGAPKMYVDGLTDFGGAPIKWEDWYIGTGATLGQTVYSSLLSTAPIETDILQKTRDRELYFMFKKALYQGSAYHIVEQTAANESGHQVWKDLNEWFGSAEVSRTVIDYYRSKLNSLKLTQTSEANDYINDYILCSSKLEAKNEGYTAETKFTKFLDGIEDDDYDVAVQNLRSDSTKTFQEAVLRIRTREQELLKSQRDATAKARRATTSPNGSGHESSKKSRSSDDKAIPSIPNWLLQSIKPDTTRKDLIRWRGIFNSEARHMRADEASTSASSTGNDNSKKKRSNSKSKRNDDASVGSDKPRHSDSNKKQRTKKSRRTKTSSSGLSATPQVYIKDEDDHDDDSISTESEDDSSVKPAKKSKAAKSMKSKKGTSKRAKPKKKVRFNPVLRDGRVDDESPRVVLDEGTEFEVIGGSGWLVLEQFSKSANMGGWRSGMEGPTLPIVNAVCAYEDVASGKTILLGVGSAAWDDRPEQSEALINTHAMRKNNVIVHNIAKRDGGLQRIEVGTEIVNLDFTDSEKLLTFRIRKPTHVEVNTLGINWLTPRIPINAPDLLKQSLRRGKGSIVPENSQHWESRMGNSPELVTAKTIEATTQLCAQPVEMENREAPRQHRKQRLLPLHPRRLEGRTDSDTFFASEKSIRNFTCVQLFFHIFSGYLYVRCMRREAHSHGAYQDFVRDIGAPNLLLTDNAQTQVGQKWTKTSRDNVTKQIATVPHNQQQNQAERKIRDAKTRVLLALRKANAPVTFWCYCLQWIVDCLNHTAHKQLDWRTPKELLDGDTPDISMFRFSFFEPVWYYEPTAKYPDPNFLPGRFVGIAWDHGDAFTYKIWTCPKGHHSDGQELIRNIVKSRVDDGDSGSPLHTIELEFDPGKRKKRKKRKHNVVSGEENNPEGQREAQRPRREETVAKRRINSQVSFSAQLPTDIEANNPSVTGHGTNSEEPGGEEEQDKETSINNKTEIVNQNTTEVLETTIGTEMVDEINEELDENRPESTTIGGSSATRIDSHRWQSGQLQLRVLWDTGQPSWEAFRLLKVDHPRMTAAYIVENNVTRSTRQDSDRTLQWAKKSLRDIERAVRRIAMLYDYHLDANDDIYKSRRVGVNGKKRKKQKPKELLKYGVQVPRNVAQAYELDKKNGNTFWHDAIKLEIDSLIGLECFEFHPSGHKPGSGYQWTSLTVIFDVKQDLRRKARLVAGGHLVDSLDNNVYSSTVKGISVRVIHVLAHKMKLKLLCGDVGNAYVNAYTNELVYSRCGKEFGPNLEGKTVVIKKALYGLRTSSERWWSHFADTLRGLGFNNTRYDKDVWLRTSACGTHYEYVCTHSDDFMIAARDAQGIMNGIKETYNIKSEGPPDYYLGNDFKQDKKGRWCFGCKRYIKEAIIRIETMFGTIPKSTVPMTASDHPETDDSEVLDDEKHRQFQMLMGILNWIVTIGRLDVAFATMSLSRFSACPRQGHLDRAIKVFGYLKKRPNRRICVDSRDPSLQGFESELEKDFSKTLCEEYPDSTEEIDAKLPSPKVSEISITAFVDSDHAHDKVTRRSVTGLIIFLGRTPIFFSSKRQGAIETSTYGAEFCAMRTAVEELISVRYMMRCLGMKVEYASLLFGDNLGVVQNATMKESLLKKKHVAISYHKVREAAASGIVHPLKIDGKYNFADVCTKAQTNIVFHTLCGGVMYG